MRGFLLLIVLGVLVWFGYQSFQQVEAGGDGGPGVGVVARPETSTTEPEAGAPQGDGYVPVRRPTRPPVEDDPVLEERPERRTDELAAAATADEPGTQAPGRAEDPRLPDPRGAGGGAQGSGKGGRQLPKASGGADAELGLLLRNAAVFLEAEALDERFAANDGQELPAGRFNLVSAFWLWANGSMDEARAWMERIEDSPTGVTTLQLDLLRGAIEGDAPRTVAAAVGRRDPLALAMSMAMLDVRGQEAEERLDWKGAALDFSDALQLEISAPWPADKRVLARWRERLNRAQEHHRLHPSGDWPSIEYEVRNGQNLIGIRAEVLRSNPGILLCTGLIERTNHLGRYIREGQLLRVPKTRPNVLVDLDARIALYRHGEEVVRAWEIGIGKVESATPVGTFRVGEKQENPSWFPPGEPYVPFGDPKNPLGTRWIAWFQDGDKTSYGFHGTSDPSGVGGRVSRGCVRMRNEDVEELFDLLPEGSEVVVQP